MSSGDIAMMERHSHIQPGPLTVLQTSQRPGLYRMIRGNSRPFIYIERNKQFGKIKTALLVQYEFQAQQKIRLLRSSFNPEIFYSRHLYLYI